MDNNLNITYITIDAYVELNKYRFVYFVIMFTAYILIICFNSTIVCLIVIHKNLHEPMYIFIAALLMNSVLFSTATYPKILFDVLSEKQIISYSACLFQWFITYSLGGSEFLLLAAMSYDRYVSICKPLQYPTIMTKTNICILVVVAWILPAGQFAVPIGLSADTKLCKYYFKGILCNSTVYKLHCEISAVLNIYGLICLINILFLPVLFVLFTYIRIFIISYQSGREVRRKAAQTCLPHLIVLINFSCLNTFDVLLLQLENDFPTIVRLIMTLQVIVYHPLFNPVIYGLKMTEIYKRLNRLFCPGKRG
ncbi:olfactory receptor 11A1-like [Mastacembelus armatus]|uniref:olfactory receptor 11A1-like n=1 Tax=Mastacembelus armatus TaxID=205130 RepID=UPI000E45EED8|nr:olfactory receptor 11A1-like [Mastacembelus armatus]